MAAPAPQSDGNEQVRPLATPLDPRSALPDLLHALSVIGGLPDYEIRARFDTACAETAKRRLLAVDPSAVVADVVRRVNLSPTPYESKQLLLVRLSPWDVHPHGVTRDDAVAVAEVCRGLSPRVPAVERPAVAAAGLTDAQAAIWLTLIELDRLLDAPWCLVGAQLTALHCVENGVAPRPVDDGAVAIGVWTHREALEDATSLVVEQGYREDTTHDGHGYRYRRGTASIDLLIPRDLVKQRRRPTTLSGRPGLSTPGANQALTRTERVPVRIGSVSGFLLRPNLLGALVATAAATEAESHTPDHAQEDFAVLASLFVKAAELQDYATQTTPKDRRRLKAVLDEMPADHPAWLASPDGNDAREPLSSFAEAGSVET